MKKLFIFLAFLLSVFFTNAFATILTVSNNTGSPGQYTNLQTAIDAAAHYDTILVAGSTTSYGDITFGKPLTLIGAGYNNAYGNNTTVGTITLTRQTYYISASGSKIMGFITNYIYLRGDFSGGTAASQTIDNLVIERCNIYAITFGSYNLAKNLTFNNDTIRNCVIGYQVERRNYNDYSYMFYYNNIVFHNNIFNGTRFSFGEDNNGQHDLKTFYLKNNIFLNRQSNVFYYCKNMILENNIFYGAEPQGGTGCVFTRNLTYMCVNNTIPGTGNLGSGNKVNQNPLFVNVPPQGGFSYSYDYHLQAGSPGENAGTDGTDIGIHGGMMPFEVGANPYIPQMTETTLPSGSSVPAGGTLNIHFKARKQN